MESIFRKSKEQKLQEWLTSPVHEDDHFRVKGSDSIWFALGASQTKAGYMICNTDNTPNLRKEVNMSHPDIYKVADDYQGVNPFVENSIRFTNYDIQNILSTLGYERRERKIKCDKLDDGLDFPYVNFEPYFIMPDGSKEHYQRGYVWTEEQKKALITTIYKGLDAGRIIVHTHPWDYQEKMVRSGYTDFASRDVVDGKQRLLTVLSFVNDEFADEYGNYFTDLSNSAQRAFWGYSGFSFGQIEVPMGPAEIAKVFLNNASAGTPISKEHMDYMKSLLPTLNKA